MTLYPAAGTRTSQPNWDCKSAAKPVATVSSPCTTNTWRGLLRKCPSQASRALRSACADSPPKVQISARTEMSSPSSRTRLAEGGLVMNKSEVLKALEWVDQTARDGDELRLAKAKLALEDELASE